MRKCQKMCSCSCLIFIVIISSDVTLKIVNGARPSKFRLPDRFVDRRDPYVMSLNQLEKEYNAIDFYRGKPDFLPPIFVRDALLNVTMSEDPSVHQYTSFIGHPKLTNAISRLYSELINQELKPEENVIITSGATEALFITVQAHTLTGDEWIIIEPAYISYAPIIKAAGGIPKYIQLKLAKTRGKINSRNWSYDRREMTKLFNRKTKGILLNNPHNPTGKVFTREELQFIADLAKKWNTLVVSDEVYEWLIYKPNKHVRIASLPDMFNRTITVGSASKTFSVTGWRIGWAYGPSDLLQNLKLVQFHTAFASSTPLQIAIASAIKGFLIDSRHLNMGLATLMRELEYKRNYMLDLLERIGMEPTVPEGGYYITANWTGLRSRVRLEDEHDEYNDARFVRVLAKNAGVLPLPLTDMYNSRQKRDGEDFVRFFFVKKNVNLDKAARLLLEWLQ